MKHLIAFAGPKGSGKTTLAKLIKKHSTIIPGPIHILSFSGPLKRMLAAILPEGAFLPENKERENFGLCGKTPRFLMQTLGTEWGRKTVHEDFWVEAMRHELRAIKEGTIIIDDLRFENEAKLIWQACGQIWEVRRPGHEYSPDHASEAGIDRNFFEGIIESESEEMLVETARFWNPFD